MEKDIIEELSNYSKEALINAFIKNNLFSTEQLLSNVKHEEVKIIVKKQNKLIKEMKNLHHIDDSKRYNELKDSYIQYDKQTDKLLDL